MFPHWKNLEKARQFRKMTKRRNFKRISYNTWSKSYMTAYHLFLKGFFIVKER